MNRLPRTPGSVDPVHTGTVQPPSASPLLPPVKGKQKLLSPSLEKKHQNSPIKRSFKIPSLEKRERERELDSERSAICALLDRQPSAQGVSATVRALELEFPPGGIGGRAGAREGGNVGARRSVRDAE